MVEKRKNALQQHAAQARAQRDQQRIRDSNPQQNVTPHTEFAQE